MREFKAYHPVVNFIYFVFVIGFSVFFMHPICLITTFVCGVVYMALLKGASAVKTWVLYMIPMLVITSVINPAFNHEGMTILYYLPNGNPLTLESVVYGIASAVMLISVIVWFSCYNEIMTSDKFVYLFGKIMPSLSLILSMSLRFIPRLIDKFKEVSGAQKCIGRDISNGSLIQRVKNGMAILSVVITWALENSVETADSMKSRGYGIKGRTAFSIFTFSKRDGAVLLCIIFLAAYILTGSFFGGIYFRYFPSMKWTEPSVWGTSIFAAYFVLCALPSMIGIWEEFKWKAIKSKI